MNIKFIQSTTKQVRPDKNLVILESTEIKYDVLIKKSQDCGFQLKEIWTLPSWSWLKSSSWSSSSYPHWTYTGRSQQIE
jgi:hypothetical protein